MIQKILKYTGICFLVIALYQVLQLFFLSLPSSETFVFQDDSVFRTCLVDAVMIAVCLCLLHTVLSNVRLGILKPVRFSVLPWFGLMFIALLLGQCAATAIYMANGDSAYDSYVTVLSDAENLFYILLAVFLAPMCEELYCRGVIYRSLRELMPVLPAAVLSSLFFALIHGTVLHLIPTFLLAMVSALAFEATNRIWISILLHAGNNLIVLWIGGVTFPDFLFHPLFLILGIGGFCGVLVALCFTVKRRTVEDLVVDITEETAVES